MVGPQRLKVLTKNLLKKKHSAKKAVTRVIPEVVNVLMFEQTMKLWRKMGLQSRGIHKNQTTELLKGVDFIDFYPFKINNMTSNF